MAERKTQRSKAAKATAAQGRVAARIPKTVIDTTAPVALSAATVARTCRCSPGILS
jgi:hypothetical protein